MSAQFSSVIAEKQRSTGNTTSLSGVRMEGKLVFPSEDDIQRYINHSGCEKKRAIAMLVS
jgi:hypothetical protein